jgi:outer membrane protein assembly factor BamE (lipoprotein component of BamABCDE complex)
MVVFHMNVNPRSLLLLATAALTLAACAVPEDQRGNLPPPETLAQIQPGVTDKATVTRLLGSPSTIATFDDHTWYYVSQKTKAVAFFKPEMLDQEVVAVDFDDNGVVRALQHRDLADGETIVPNPRATPAPGREFSFIEQLIGNFGRFSDKPKNPEGGNGGGGTPQQ